MTCMGDGSRSAGAEFPARAGLPLRRAHPQPDGQPCVRRAAKPSPKTSPLASPPRPTRWRDTSRTTGPSGSGPVVCTSPACAAEQAWITGAATARTTRWPTDWARARSACRWSGRGSSRCAGASTRTVLAGYRERLLAMQAAGLRPVVTLHHFTHPAWFHRETPWHEPESVSAFRAYVRVCAQLLRGLDAVVLSLNEPMVLLLGGYLQGLIPPGISDGRKLVAAAANMVRAHVAAREEIRSACGPLPLGISQNMLTFAPDRPWHPLDRALCRLGAQAYNHAFLEALSCGVLRLEMPGVARTRQVIPGARDVDRVRGDELLHARAPALRAAAALHHLPLPRSPGTRAHAHRLGGLSGGLRSAAARDAPLRPAGVDHRERHRRSRGLTAAALPPRALAAAARRAPRGRGRAGLSALEPDGQLRMARGLGPALRALPRGLRDPGAQRDAGLRLLPRGGPGAEAGGTPASGARSRRVDRRQTIRSAEVEDGGDPLRILDATGQPSAAL